MPRSRLKFVRPSSTRRNRCFALFSLKFPATTPRSTTTWRNACWKAAGSLPLQRDCQDGTKTEAKPEEKKDDSKAVAPVPTATEKKEEPAKK